MSDEREGPAEVGNGEEPRDPHEAEKGGEDAPATPDLDLIGAERTPGDIAVETSRPGDLTDGGLREEIEKLMRRYPQVRSASIPALHAVQRRDGWCTPEGIREAAEVIGVEPAYLESVASFYDLFHTEPSGEHRILVCTNISCWMCGADRLLERFCEAAGVDADAASHGGAVSDGGAFYVSGFECLGACDIAPMASVDQRYYGPLDDADAAEIVAQLRAGTEILPAKAVAKRPAAGGPEPEPDPRIAAD